MRRGLVALAAGVLAGVSAKLTEKPVEAADGEAVTVGLTKTASGGNSVTGLNGTVTNSEGLLRLHNANGRALNITNAGGDNALYVNGTNGAAIYGKSTNNAGIFGEAVNTFGLLGYSQTSSGLFGGGLGPQPGVLGRSTGGPAIRGDGGIDALTGQPNGNNQAGVYGTALSGIGVQGLSTTGEGARGQSTSGYGIHALSSSNAGLYAESTSSAGAWGVSSQSIGVLGVGSTGVLGQATSGFGVTGTATTGVALRASGRSELYGDVEIGDFEDSNPNKPRYNLNVTGDLQVAGQKSAIVKGADGAYRLFYCLESAESYFEDFGTARLAGGNVRIELKNDFKQFVSPDRGFFVFLTPLGDTPGLWVSRDKNGFEVHEVNRGQGNIEFQYRVVCRRADVAGNRLEKADPAARRPGQTRPANVDVPAAPPRHDRGADRYPVPPPPRNPLPPVR